MDHKPSKPRAMLLALMLAAAPALLVAQPDGTPRNRSAERFTAGENPIGNPQSPSVRSVAEDATITARVKTALLDDRDIAGMKIEVDTKGGIVTLGGTVHSTGQSQRAVAMTRRVEGVVDVVNRFTIAP